MAKKEKNVVEKLNSLPNRRMLQMSNLKALILQTTF